MNTEAPSASSFSFSQRLPGLASIGRLAATIFGLARFGIGAVPVWMLAVPFMLLACMDFEGRFRQVSSTTGRLGMIAFHFVIVGTVVAAHQQLGAARATAGGGGGSGGCGSLCGGGQSGCGACGGGGDTKSRTAVSGPMAPVSRTIPPSSPKGPLTVPGSNPTSTSPGVPPEVLRQIQTRATPPTNAAAPPVKLPRAAVSPAAAPVAAPVTAPAMPPQQPASAPAQIPSASAVPASALTPQGK